MKVAKFGGTSLADAGQILKICAIVKADPDRRIIVVSAPGKRNPADTKVTDLLIACAEAMLAHGAAEQELGVVVQRFAEIQKEIGLPASVTRELEDDLRQRLAGGRAHHGKYLDSLKAAGEDHCAKLVAAAFRQQGLDAHYVSPCDAGLLLSSEFGNARVLPESYARLAALRHRPGVTIFPGFFGCTAAGEVATFPRGGSDITGAILAAAVKADVYENFTDVDSVYACDPRIVPEAPAITLLTYREMRELAYAGFSVFHDEAIVPVVQAHVPICIKNTNRPAAPGTLISPERPYAAGAVVGVASADGFSTIFVSKYLMNREVGFGRRLLQILEEEHLPYEHVPSGIDSTSVILRRKLFTPVKAARVVARIRSELTPDDIEIEHGLALLMIVGEGMRYTVGLAAKATRALADAGVNIEMLNQGASEISIMFGVKEADRKPAVRALYRAFFSPEDQGAELADGLQDAGGAVRTKRPESSAVESAAGTLEERA
ncbi:MAG: aspartate kinase [Kiritimatiellaeota bacterium]|nr:aspartate kinase [Kiritimatiellota bacterium]